MKFFLPNKIVNLSFNLDLPYMVMVEFSISVLNTCTFERDKMGSIPTLLLHPSSCHFICVYPSLIYGVQALSCVDPYMLVLCAKSHLKHVTLPLCLDPAICTVFYHITMRFFYYHLPSQSIQKKVENYGICFGIDIHIFLLLLKI